MENIIEIEYRDSSNYALTPPKVDALVGFRDSWSCGRLVLWKRESVGPVYISQVRPMGHISGTIEPIQKIHLSKSAEFSKAHDRSIPHTISPQKG